MPITRKLLAQDMSDENQILKMDSAQRYIVSNSDDWQFLFGPNSELTNSAQVVKIAGQFDAETFDNVKLTAYLYNPITGAVDNAASCLFTVYQVSDPTWTETLIASFNGTLQPNNHYYSNPTLADLSPADLFGQTTLMVEAVITRLGVTYRDRVYINHLGVYDNIFRLRQDVEFLDLTKKDE